MVLMPRSLTTHIDSPQAFGVRLKASRLRAGLSQRRLSFPGCTAAYISRLEAGARVPSLQMVNELASRLEVSAQWLATGVESAAPERVDLIEAEVALRLGDVLEAERHYRARLQPGDPARGAALAGLGQIAFRADRLDDAVELLEQALDARQGRLLADPSAVDTLGCAYAMKGELRSTIALYERAVAEAHEFGAPVEQLRFLVLLSNALVDAGIDGRAESALDEAIRVAGTIEDPLAAARVFWSQSRLHGSRHEPELAARYASRALDILERTENDAFVARAYHLLAFAENDKGNHAAALQAVVRGRELVGGTVESRTEARFAIEEARALAGLHRNAEAGDAAAHALAAVDAIEPYHRGRAYLLLGEVMLATGEHERGRLLLTRALDVLVEHGQRGALDAGRRLADLLEAEGDTAGALEVLKRATVAAASAR